MEITIALIYRCTSNDRLAQKQLYATLLPYLNIICQRYLNNASDIRDVLQESFISIFKNIKQYDASKSGFKTWATRITINRCLKNNIRGKKSRTQELIIPLHEETTAPDILKKLSDEELLIWFKKMPEQYFQVFNLFVIDGFSHQEIAKILNIEEALSRKRLSRSRVWLKKRIPTNFDISLKLYEN